MNRLTIDPQLFFDTDCLSAFLWIKDECLLTKLYPGRIVIPQQVYDELGQVPHLQARVKNLLNRGDVILLDIQANTPEHTLYAELTRKAQPGNMVIGRGEAASITLAKSKNGIVASNNLKDIMQYITKYGPQYKTTADILVEAYRKGFISESDGNTLWMKMLRKGRHIGAASFTEYLNRTKK